jgi:thioredoxin 1
MPRRHPTFQRSYKRTKETAMAGSINALSAATFDEVIGSASEPVLVDFWAEWCGPCKMIAPILQEIAEEQAGKIKIVKLNVDEAPDVAMKYQVMSIPTLIVFKDGEEAMKLVGARGKAQLLESLSAFL